MSGTNVERVWSRAVRRALAGMVVAAAAAVVAARDPLFADPFWDVRFDAASFAARPRAGDLPQLFAGASDAGVAVEVLVLEEETEREPVAWAKELLERWKREGRPLAGVQGPDEKGVLLFTDAGLAGARRRHAYQVRPRGVHGFVAHAVGKPGDDAALRSALTGLAVGEWRGASLGAARAARTMGLSPSDPSATLRAIRGYLGDDGQGRAIAAQVASAAMLSAPDGTYAADDVWETCHSLGLAFLLRRENAAALTWLGRARDRAAGTSQRDEAISVTLYNLACAHAVSGAKDAAFAALEELVAAGLWEHHAAWAQADEDLASLRTDDRWKKLPAPKPVPEEDEPEEE